MGDENKKLRLKCEQFCEQLEKKKTEIAKFCEDRDVAMKEVLKLREERDLAKTFMEKAAADIHSKDIMIRNMETNFEHQRQALQIEFNVSFCFDIKFCVCRLSQTRFWGNIFSG